MRNNAVFYALSRSVDTAAEARAVAVSDARLAAQDCGAVAGAPDSSVSAGIGSSA